MSVKSFFFFFVKLQLYFIVVYVDLSAVLIFVLSEHYFKAHLRNMKYMVYMQCRLSNVNTAHYAALGSEVKLYM